jgi:hypothetical protein
LIGRLEHLDELEQPAVGQAQAAGVGVGVRIILGVLLQLADVDLADQRGDVLVVLVARLGLGHGNLAQYRGAQLDDAERVMSPLNSCRRLTAHGLMMC